MDIKQLLTLHIDGMSNRKIASTLGISRNTINNYVRTINSCGYSDDELLSMEEYALHELFPTHSSVDAERYKELTAHFEHINKGLKEPGFTFLHHYEIYKDQAVNPYSYTQFMEHYHRKHAREKGSMKLEHEAGYELFIDFAGDRLSFTDPETGEVKDVEVFVAILPSSQYTYVEACPSQGRKDLIHCITNALKFYDGVPKAIVTDNLKAAVTRACKYEPKINRSLKDMATHYGCVINPTRTYSPQDKALVEHAVQLIYQRIYYPLRNITFFSLEQLNQAIRKELEKHNAKRLSLKQVSRYELFHSIEKNHLKPLPTSPYEYKEYCRVKVQKMGYVLFSPDKNYYSVPYR